MSGYLRTRQALCNDPANKGRVNRLATLIHFLRPQLAPVTTGLAGERSYLLVERYDRRGEGEAVSRLHQDDFCQALGRSPAARYEFNGSGVRGTSLAAMFALKVTAGVLKPENLAVYRYAAVNLGHLGVVEANPDARYEKSGRRAGFRSKPEVAPLRGRISNSMQRAWSRTGSAIRANPPI